ncbi:MAG: hypothetical protein LAO79_19185 [Acidobacteriia bacterium]|nr:hypothetical protein [Terriglobia bacterium]
MKFLVPLTFSLLLSAAAWGQQRPPQPQEQQPPSDSQATTVTGCLAKGTNAGEYSLKDNKTGQTYTFAGPERLDSYLNHTVALTGKMLDRGGEKSFQPQSIRTVSDTCTGSLR